MSNVSEPFPVTYEETEAWIIEVICLRLLSASIRARIKIMVKLKSWFP